MNATPFPTLDALATHLRQELEVKKFVLLYGYNATGKTRLSTAFKDLGKKGDERDTLYFNAFTEDLFSWDNDIENDRDRVLRINSDSRFFAGLGEMEMDNRIRPILDRYADFDFRIDTTDWQVTFSREIPDGDNIKTEYNIKISRGEENIFIFCFFLAIVQLVLDGAEAYNWVQYIYIDDPISSLDENNAITVANHLAHLLLSSDNAPKTVISSHHVLFFNVLCNEFRNRAYKHLLTKAATPETYLLQDTTSRPFLYHLATLVELDQAQNSGALYTHHFNMLRRVMEQTASFFGFSDWTHCITVEGGDLDKALYKRVIDLMSHGDYSLYEPREMMEDNKAHFRTVFRRFVACHPFSPALFTTAPAQIAAQAQAPAPQVTASAQPI